jgi:hypothetical protein
MWQVVSGIRDLSNVIAICTQWPAIYPRAIAN